VAIPEELISLAFSIPADVITRLSPMTIELATETVLIPLMLLKLIIAI
jgi:hypothetical protein